MTENAPPFNTEMSNDKNTKEAQFKKISEELSSDPFFSQSPKTNISQPHSQHYTIAELNRVKVFKHIEQTQPTNIYKVAKELSMAYNTCSYIIRDLIFAGVVSEKMKFNENNQAYKELTIPKEKKENGTN